MTPALRMVTWSTTAAVAVTGLVYGGMLYCLSPENPNDLVNHAWQPAMQYLHVLAAPVWLVAFGVLWHAHVLPKLQSREAARWRSGIALLVLSVAMAASGYLLQTSVEPWVRSLWVVAHVSTSIAWLAVLAVHVLARRPGGAGPQAQRGAGSGRDELSAPVSRRAAPREAPPARVLS